MSTPSRRTFLTATAALSALTLTGTLLAASAEPTPGHANPAPGVSPSMNPPLRKYNVTIRRFNPQLGLASGEDFILPVDSPDQEHAVSSTMANAVSFTTKTSGSSLLPVAFTCTAIAERG